MPDGHFEELKREKCAEVAQPYWLSGLWASRPHVTPVRLGLSLAGVARSPDVSGDGEYSGNKDFAGKPAGETVRSTLRPNRGGKTRSKSAAGSNRLRCIPKNQPE